MGSFILGVAVAGAVNIITALLSRRRGLQVLPWVLFYIYLHGAYVVFTGTECGQGFVMTHKGWLGYLIAAGFSLCVWTLIIYSVDHLDKSTSEEQPSPPPSLPQEGVSESTQLQWETIDETLREILFSPIAPHSPQARYAFIQRHAETLRKELRAASASEKPRVINKLTQSLMQQLRLLGDIHQRPSHQYRDQFNAITKEIEELRDLSKRLGR